MKFVKENMVLVIVGAVVVLLLVAAFAYPLPGFKADLQAQMQEKANQAQAIKEMAGKSIELPGAQTQKGVPTQAYVEEKQKVIESINTARMQVEADAQKRNSQGRVEGVVPILPVPQKADFSQVGMSLVDPGTKKSNVLPHANDPMEFKTNYQRVFRIWTNLLAAGTLTDTGPVPATPPKLEDLQQTYSTQLAAELAKLPVAPGGMQGNVQVGNIALTNRKFYDFAKGQVMNRAAGIQMYIEPSPGGFQIRDWAFRDQAPSDEQIFDGMVDLWIQADIVKAIAQVNNKAMGVGGDRNVGKAAIKRLTSIIIGNNARNHRLGTSTPGGPAVSAAPAANGQVADPGPLFFTSVNASAAGGGGPVLGTQVNPSGGGAAPQGTAVDNTINYELSMTGRSGGKQYDVVHVSILIDIDPSQLNAFEKALYMQNMGYTVEGEQTKTVDPLDRASYGYLYGDSQVVEAEIQVEALFFRDWTSPLMPATVAAPLGVAQPAAAGTVPAK